jgi:hypothetical protein
MPYQVACIDGVFLLRWGVDVTAEDIRSIEKDLLSHSGNTEEPLVFVGIVSDYAGVPSASLRKEMSDGMSEMAKVCREMHVVIGGAGFQAAARRLVTSGITLVSGQKLKVHSSLEDALRSARVSEGTKFSVLRAFNEFNQQVPEEAAGSEDQQQE